MSSAFPFFKNELPPPEEQYRALTDQDPREYKTADEGNTLVRIWPTDYHNADGISNHFTEEQRLRCNVLDWPSPIAIWNSREQARLRQRLASKQVSPEAAREVIYAKTRTCSIFNPSWVKWVIANTVGEGASVLDPSAGWGDRMIGSAAAGATSYLGFDPNPALAPAYKSIARVLELSDNFRVVESVFPPKEKGALAKLDNQFDIALTSPPYGPFEEYEGTAFVIEDGKRVTLRVPKFDEWVADVYTPYLRGMVSAVRPKGWVIVRIHDVRRSRGKEHYPLTDITRRILLEAGAKEDKRRFDFRVDTVDQPRKPGSVRTCLVFRKPKKARTARA